MDCKRLTYFFLFFFLILTVAQPKSEPDNFGKKCIEDGKPHQAQCGFGGLICSKLTGTCTYCSSEGNQSATSLCQEAFDELHVCRDDLCERKHLLERFNIRDVLVPIFLLFGGAVAAAGGVGGGGIFVPILILVGAFTVKEAVPLSKALIFGASIANVCQMWVKRHPTADRPLIDYNLAFILQPLALAGTSIGVIFNVIFPNWLILIFLVITLSATTYKTTKKGIKIWKKESKNSKKVAEGEDVDLADLPLNKENDEIEKFNGVSLEEGEDTEDENFDSGLLKILSEETKVPWIVVLTLFAILILNSLASILKGGSHESSIVGVESCTTDYWILFFLPLPFLILLTFIWGNRLLRLHEKKEEISYPWQEGDIRWTRKRLLVTGLVTFMAGIMASCLGIGGGMVLSPLMLELAVLPEVTAATSTFMILFTSSSSVIQYLVIGKLLIDYALLYGIIGLVASFFGQKGIDYIVGKYNKKSYIVFAIAIVIGASTIMLFTTGMIDVVRDWKQGSDFGFHPLC